MTQQRQCNDNISDPLGLGDLEAVEPGYDGWTEIESALQTGTSRRRNWQRMGGWLAVAASFTLVIGVSLRNTQNSIPANHSSELATTATGTAFVPAREDINALIGLSQSMENQLKKFRRETNVMPAESAIYVAELEDMIAQVDSELSLTPDSMDLWGQRVNLMLDLARLYQQQWQIDYGRMASL